MMKKILVLAIILISAQASAQKATDEELLKIAKWGDSLVFERGFNHCDMKDLASVISEDFEFYHDQGGITRGREDFVKSMQEGICKLNYKAIRKPVAGSMKVFPLYDKGKLYGLIVHGDHEFWAIEKGKPEYKTGLARYSSLWLLDNGKWMFRRAYSYDHRAVQQ